MGPMQIIQVVPAPNGLQLCYAVKPASEGEKPYFLSTCYYLALVEIEVKAGGEPYRALLPFDIADGYFEIVDDSYTNFVGLVVEGDVSDDIINSAWNLVRKK